MSIPDLEALIFDVDGTLADTESAHLAAFNQAFAEFGLDWHWDEALYTDLLNISGGKERIQQYWKTSQPELRELEAMAMQETVNRLHELKTAAYESAVNDGAVSLRPGVLKLMDEALAHGVQLAITTPPPRPSILGPCCAVWLVRTGGSTSRRLVTHLPRPSKSRIRRSTGRCCRCSSLRQRSVWLLKTPAADCARPRQRRWHAEGQRTPCAA